MIQKALGGIGIISFWVFLAGKVMGGVFFSAWSWWWVLFSIIPFVAWVLSSLGVSL